MTTALYLLHNHARQSLLNDRVCCSVVSHQFFSASLSNNEDSFAPTNHHCHGPYPCTEWCKGFFGVFFLGGWCCTSGVTVNKTSRIDSSFEHPCRYNQWKHSGLIGPTFATSDTKTWHQNEPLSTLRDLETRAWQRRPKTIFPWVIPTNFGWTIGL